jgi:nucleotidyltransferase/DNA polymerase involved in DNA repair
MGPVSRTTIIKIWVAREGALRARFTRSGVRTGLDLKARTLEFLQQHFEKVGSYYYWAARAIDERPVRADRIRKSIGAENTFPADLFTYEAARDQLREIIDKVWSYCERSGARGRTVTLKVKFANFRQITRRHTGQVSIAARSELEQLSNACSNRCFRSPRASGSSASPCPRSRQQMPNVSARRRIPCRSRRELYPR